MMRKQTPATGPLSSIMIVLVALPFSGALESAAAQTFDGVYRGSERTTLTNHSGTCARIDSDNVMIRVQNNQFTRRWGLADLQVTVAADGSFDARQSVGEGRATGTPRVVELKGRITGGNLEADIGSTYCGAHLSLKKV